MNLGVSIGLDERSNACDFTLDDPNYIIASKYIDLTLTGGGIVGLPPQEASATQVIGPSGNVGLPTAGLNYTEEQINRALQSLVPGNPLTGADFLAASRASGVSVDALVTQALIESSLGTAGRGAVTRNPLNYANDDSGNNLFFPTFREGLTTAAKALKQDFYFTTPEDFIARDFQGRYGRYATDPDYGPKYSAALKQVRQALGTPAIANSSPQSVTPSATPSATSKAPANQPVVEPKQAETKEKGKPILIRIGFSPDSLAEFAFIHTGTEIDLKRRTVTFQGQSVRWMLNRRIKNQTYSNITLQNLAELFAKEHGFAVDYKAPDIRYSHLDRTQLTDYQLLLREAKWAGLQVLEKPNDNKTLVIQKPEAVDSGFVVRLGENFAEGRISDRALSDLAEVPKGASISQPVANTGKSEAKWRINPKSGLMEQVRPEQESTRHGAASGAKQMPPTGTTTTSFTGQRESTVRVKGLPSEFVMVTDGAALSLQPGNAILTEGFGGALDRAWVLDNVEHRLESGVLKTTLSCFAPMERAATGQTTPSTATSTSAQTGANLSDSLPGTVPTLDGWQWPIQGTVIQPAGEFGNNRGTHIHAGIDIGGFGPDQIYAASNGVVVIVQNDGGAPSAGLWLEIRHSDGYSTRYFHNNSISVRVGDQVKRGQPIAIRGNTGTRDIHLHFEVRRNGQALNPRSVLPQAGAPPRV